MTTEGRAPDGAHAATGSAELSVAGSVAVLTVTGSLDFALAPKMVQQIERAARLRLAVLVIDLAALEFLASAGMAALLRAHREHRETMPVRLVIDRPLIRRPLELTRLTDELAIFPDLPSAIGDS